jgi:cytochrome c peroxidase
MQRPHRHGWLGLTSACLLLAVPTLKAQQSGFYVNDFQTKPSAARLSELGKLLFFDVALSASGKVACASCHDPTHAYAAPNGLAVQHGGGDGRAQGLRAVPSLMYQQNVPPFTEHFVDDEGDDSVDQGPAGGRMWDGRAQSAHEQARLPLFSSFEMANRDEAGVLSAIERGPYAKKFRDVLGASIFSNKALAFKGVLLALESFQQEPADFYPYTSKYDAWLRGQAVLSAVELRGLAVFNDRRRGNCARCHPSGRRQGAWPQFTDFGFAAIGVPRNKDIAANQDPKYFDLGLCGPLREDLRDRKEYCGMFRTPSLRNVAMRRVFFHNGAVRSLKEAVAFYATRDTEPKNWYPSQQGEVRKFDDLPKEFVENLDSESPFDRRRGAAAAMNDQEVEEVVAFLQALSDGFVVPSPK